MLKLNLGCGEISFEGWVNIDWESPKADINLNLTAPLPYGDNTVNFIYSEHFIEHLTLHEGLALLTECRRVLKPKGVIRIATPNLDYLMRKYFFFWKKQVWIKKYGYTYLKTRAEMINLCFTEWGHKYLYNKQELTRRLEEVGFNNIYKKKLGESKYEELKNRETRKDSTLILEAEK